MRGFSPGDGKNEVFFMPRGSKTYTFAKDVQRHVRDPVHDLAERDEIDVAVTELGPRV